MKKETILITGAGPNGVTGRRIKEFLQDKYTLLTPTSKELDLRDGAAVNNYFNDNCIDFVIHSAVQAPSMGHDNSKQEEEVESNLRMYFNLASNSGKFQKMFYFGSGAEFDKSRDIVNVKEEEALYYVPVNRYGFIKNILNRHASKSRNIYNLRLFGTINPYEPYTRNVVSNLCAKAALGLPLNLKRDCIFSFIDIDDVAKFIDFGINNELKHHDYNMCGWKGRIGEIAEIISNLSEKSLPVIFEDNRFNKEYNGNSIRLQQEFTKITDILESLNKVTTYFKLFKESIDLSAIDNRWGGK